MFRVEGFGELIETLDSKGVDYRVVGGVARRAHLHDEYTNFDDVDIILSDASRQAPHRLRHLADSGLYLDTHIAQFVSYSSQNASIKIMGTQAEVDTDVFEPRILELRGVRFPSVDARTLLHLNLLQEPLRPKDWVNSLQLGRAIRTRDVKCFAENKFAEWHEVAKFANKIHKLTFIYKAMVGVVRKYTPEQVAILVRPISVPLLVCAEKLPIFIDRFHFHNVPVKISQQTNSLAT